MRIVCIGALRYMAVTCVKENGVSKFNVCAVLGGFLCAIEKWRM
jgi:hypothetical protein